MGKYIFELMKFLSFLAHSFLTIAQTSSMGLILPDELAKARVDGNKVEPLFVQEEFDQYVVPLFQPMPVLANVLAL